MQAEHKYHAIRFDILGHKLPETIHMHVLGQLGMYRQAHEVQLGSIAVISDKMVPNFSPIMSVRRMSLS